jgi:hypothetical protein
MSKIEKNTDANAVERRRTLHGAEGGAAGALVGAFMGMAAGPAGILAGALVGGMTGGMVGTAIDGGAPNQAERATTVDAAITRSSTRRYFCASVSRSNSRTT